ncbi:hypothetical protein SAMN05446037_105214 [Anaerovirgula multivorans]|uniref:Uncharacterized protein n=1 Tax=Anaerovirgula multivorans TaxID=312168 RepID=A0A239KRB2_9FIRM|nr:hypothetical protein [Anaerovirgula multivorans]SNT20711.1 hypothetical protein SAMN05446037_105214 [Anaerovirgula multivorans]
MRDRITFKNLVIILWIVTLILTFSLFRFKYLSFDGNDDFVVKINRITGEVEFIRGRFR